MLKEWTRDYATGAFIRYANRGCPSVLEYEKAVREDVYRRLALLPPNLIVAKAEAAISARRPLIEDFEAIEKTLCFFREKGQGWVEDALPAIYRGLREDRPTEKNEIALRVRGYAIDHYISERSVYRILKQARLLFSRFRGVTVGTVLDEFYF